MARVEAIGSSNAAEWAPMGDVETDAVALDASQDDANAAAGAAVAAPGPTYPLLESSIALQQPQQALQVTPVVRRSLGALGADPVAQAPFVPAAAAAYTDDGYSTVVTGGLWQHDPGSRPMTPTDFDAGPVLSHPESRLESTQLAQQLASGSSVQSLLGDNPSPQQLGAMNDAFELLGISNRQLSIYAKQSALGGYDLRGGEPPPAHRLLVDAGHMRAAVDVDSKSELAGYSYTTFGERFHATSLPDDFSANGMIRSVQQGAADSGKYWQPKAAARDMIYGASTTGIARSRTGMFPDHLFSNTYEDGARMGAGILKTTGVNTWAPAGEVLSEKARDAAAVLGGDPPQTWTPVNVTEAFYAADVLRQGMAGSTQAHYAALAAQHEGYTSAADQAALLRQAVDEALADHGVTGVDAQAIGERLLEASTSPAFKEVVAGDQSRADSAYALMSWFDPQATQRAAVIDKLTETPSTPEGIVQQKATRMLLTSLAAAGPSSALPTHEDKANAAATVAQWSIASARWTMAALAKGTAVPPEKIEAYGRFIDQAVQQVDVRMAASGADQTSLALAVRYLDPAGDTIGTTFAEVEQWASRQAGLAADPTWQGYLKTAGTTLATTIDRYGIGAVAAASSAATRGYRLANPGTYQFDDATRRALIANTVADAAVITEWAASAKRFGPALSSGIRALEDAIPGNWFLRTGVQPRTDGGVANLAARAEAGLGAVMQASGNPVRAAPGSAIGQFVDWALPQAGGFGNLIYGGSNIALGLRKIADGSGLAAGTLTTVAGAIDFFNGLAQLKKAAPDLEGRWSAINTFGVDYPVWAQVASRLVAASAGVASAVLAEQNG